MENIGIESEENMKSPFQLLKSSSFSGRLTPPRKKTTPENVQEAPYPIEILCDVQCSIALDVDLIIFEENNRAITERIDTTAALKSHTLLGLGRDKFKPCVTVVFDDEPHGKLTKITYAVKDYNWLICLLHLSSLSTNSHY